MTTKKNKDSEMVPMSDEPTATERSLVAHKLRLSGMTWQEVADKAGYPTDDAARVDVRAFLQKAAIELGRSNRIEALQYEVDRLDQLQSAIWGAAITGDLKAIDTILKIISIRSKLMGLETAFDEGAGKTTTIVVPMDADAYVKTLKDISGIPE